MRTRTLPLLDLSPVVSEFARTDEEGVATVAHLVSSAPVKLGGNLPGARISFEPPRPAVATAA